MKWSSRLTLAMPYRSFGRRPLRRAALLPLFALLAAGCQADLGPCDVQAARTIVYTDDAVGAPAYAGQALVIQSCGSGAFCHAAAAEDRFGAPAGLDFDLRLATTAEETERLRQDQWNAFRFRDAIWDQVEHGDMPPGRVGAEVAASGPVYRDLPALDSSEGRAILRNWLSCGVPVVERSADDRPAGVEPVGAIVAPLPTLDPTMCAADLTVCDQMCVDTSSDPAYCGDCLVSCSAGDVCFSGGCLAGGCPGSTTDCGGACVDTDTSSVHCGGCDQPCGGGEVCTSGTCVCTGALVECGGTCVDTSTSIDHCGDCDQPCGAGETCEGGTCIACGAGVSFAADIQPIFTSTCGGTSNCHLTSTAPAKGLNLLAGSSYGNLVNVSSAECGARLRVDPGAPEASYLVDKLRGRNLCFGNRMPSGGKPALSEATIQLIEGWICAGAPNN